MKGEKARDLLVQFAAISVLFVFVAGAVFLPAGWVHEIRQVSFVDARYSACWEAAQARGEPLGWIEVIEVDGKTAWTAAVMTPDNSPSSFVRITCAYDGTTAKVQFASTY